MRFAGRIVLVRRQLMVYVGQDPGDRICVARCGSALCVNPDHLVSISRRQFYKRSRKTRVLSVTAYTRLAARNRARSKLNEELAAAVREAEGRQVDIAARFGITQGAVSLIRRGLRWANLTSGWHFLMRTKK